MAVLLLSSPFVVTNPQWNNLGSHDAAARRTPPALRRRPHPLHAPRRRGAHRLRARCSAPTSAAPPPAAAKLLPPTPAARLPPARRGATCPCRKTADGWQIELPLAEAGCFKAKAYLLDQRNWQHWPDGADVGISVHPNFARTANTIYCAFPRLFGSTKNLPLRARRKTRSANQGARRDKFCRHPAVRQVPRPDAPVAAHRPHARLPHSSFAARASDTDDLCPLRTFRQSLRRARFDRHGSGAG